MIYAIIISIAAFIIYVITRRIFIIIKKDERWRVEVRLPLGPLTIKKDVARRSGKKGRQEEKKSGSLHHYREIFHRFMRIFAYSEIEINKLTIPCGEASELPSKEATRPWKYHSFIISLLTFLRTNSMKLTVFDNAITLNSDTDKLSVDITVKVRLFRIIGTLAVFIFSENILKKKAA